MKKKVARAGGVLLLLVATLAGYFYSADRSTPAGQAPLTQVDERALAEFKEEFNRAQGRARVIALLSPT